MDTHESRKKGLGIKFYLDFVTKRTFIENHHYIYTTFFKNFQRVRLKKFPYYIYFTIDEAQKQVTIEAKRIRSIKIDFVATVLYLPHLLKANSS